MSTGDPSNEANVRSEKVDETHSAAPTRPNSHEVLDVATADDNLSATPATLLTEAKARTPGRRSKRTPETMENIRVGVAAGLPMEVAARRAGVGKTAFHDWRNRGIQALDKRSKGQALSHSERDCLEFEMMLRDAHAERLAALAERLDAEATNHCKTTTKIVVSPVIYKGDVRTDDNGEILTTSSVTRTTTEEPDTRALAALFNAAHAVMERIRDTEARANSSDGTPAFADSIEYRLAQRIRVTREEIDEELEEEIVRRVNEHLKAAGITPPSSAGAQSSVTDGDDDDEYYAFSPWVSPSVPEFEFDSGNSGNSDFDPGN